MLSPALAERPAQARHGYRRRRQGGVRLRLQAHGESLYRAARRRSGGRGHDHPRASGMREDLGSVDAPFGGKRARCRARLLRSAAARSARAVSAHDARRRAVVHPFPAYYGGGRRSAPPPGVRGAAAARARAHVAGRPSRRRRAADGACGGRPVRGGARLCHAVHPYRGAAAGSCGYPRAHGGARGGQPYAARRRGHGQNRRRGLRPCRRGRHGRPGGAHGAHRGARAPACRVAGEVVRRSGRHLGPAHGFHAR